MFRLRDLFAPPILIFIIFIGLCGRVSAIDLWVDAKATDSGNCSQLTPCRDLQTALQLAANGDKIHVLAGLYDLMDAPEITQGNLEILGDSGPSAGSSRPIFWGSLSTKTLPPTLKLSISNIDFMPSGIMPYANGSNSESKCATVLNLALDSRVPKNVTTLPDSAVTLLNVQFGSFGGVSPCIFVNVPLDKLTIQSASIEGPSSLLVLSNYSTSQNTLIVFAGLHADTAITGPSHEAVGLLLDFGTRIYDCVIWQSKLSSLDVDTHPSNMSQPKVRAVQILSSSLAGNAKVKSEVLVVKNSVLRDGIFSIIPLVEESASTYFENNTLDSMLIIAVKNTPTMLRRNRFVKSPKPNSVIYPTLWLNEPLSQRIDARMNWFGDESGPRTCCNPGGKGSIVGRSVNFNEWCLNAECGSYELAQTIDMSSFRSCELDSMCSVPDLAGSFSTVGVASLFLIVGAFAIIRIRRAHPVADEHSLRLVFQSSLKTLSIMSFLCGVGPIVILAVPRPEDLLWVATQFIVVRALIVALVFFWLHCVFSLIGLMIMRSSQMVGLRVYFVAAVSILMLAVDLIGSTLVSLMTRSREMAVEEIHRTVSRHLMFGETDIQIPQPVIVIFGSFIGVILLQLEAARLAWRLLSRRDWQEVEEMRRHVAARGSLADSSDTVLRASRTSVAFRKLSWINLPIAIVSISAAVLTALYIIVPYDALIFGLEIPASILVGNCGMSALVSPWAFFVLHFRPYDIPLLFAVTSQAGLLTLTNVSALVVLIILTMAQFVSRSLEWNAGLIAALACLAVVSFLNGLLAIRSGILIQRMRRGLQEDIVDSAYRKMELNSDDAYSSGFYSQ